VSKVGVAYANVDHGGGRVTADLDTLLTALYVLADDFLPRRPRARRRPPITDAELVCLAVAQILLDCPSERRFLCFAMVRLSHLFPYLPQQPGYNKRMRALAPQMLRSRALRGRTRRRPPVAGPRWLERSGTGSG
jgi:hypothetical protein